MSKKTTYAAFGMVRFPVHNQDYIDRGLGLLVIRAVAIDLTPQAAETDFLKSGISLSCPDDVFVGVDCYPVGLEGFRYMQEHSHLITGMKLLGSINWNGYNKRTDSFWRATVSDLDETGLACYTSMVNSMPGKQISIITSLNTEKESIRNLIEETKTANLKPQKGPHYDTTIQ